MVNEKVGVLQRLGIPFLGNFLVFTASAHIERLYRR